MSSLPKLWLGKRCQPTQSWTNVPVLPVRCKCPKKYQTWGSTHRILISSETSHDLAMPKYELWHAGVKCMHHEPASQPDCCQNSASPAPSTPRTPSTDDLDVYQRVATSASACGRPLSGSSSPMCLLACGLHILLHSYLQHCIFKSIVQA
jgi:hypothetical protein